MAQGDISKSRSQTRLDFLRELIKSVSRYRVRNKGLDIENLLKDIIAYEILDDSVLIIYTRYGLKITITPNDVKVGVV